jgi:glutaredoxin
MVLYTTGTKKCKEVEKLLHSKAIEFEVVRCVNKVGDKAQELNVSGVPFIVDETGYVMTYNEIKKFVEGYVSED